MIYSYKENNKSFSKTYNMNVMIEEDDYGYWCNEDEYDPKQLLYKSAYEYRNRFHSIISDDGHYYNNDNCGDNNNCCQTDCYTPKQSWELIAVVFKFDPIHIYRSITLKYTWRSFVTIINNIYGRLQRRTTL